MSRRAARFLLKYRMSNTGSPSAAGSRGAAPPGPASTGATGLGGREQPLNPFAVNGGRVLAGRPAIVTGSGQNIGRGLALGLAEAGANVVVNGRSNRDIVEQVAAEVRERGVHALAVMADVGDPDAVERMVNEATGKFGPIDIAISNAGIRPRQSVEEITV